MTNHRKLRELEVSGEATIVGTITPTRHYTRDELLEFVAKELKKRRNDTFTMYRWVEFYSSEQVEKFNISGTIFEVAAEVIKDKTGYTTDGTLGSIMSSPLNLSRDDVHHLACDCDVSERMVTRPYGKSRLLGKFAPSLFRDLKSRSWYQFWHG